MGGAKTPLGEYLMSQMVPTMQLGQRVLTYVCIFYVQSVLVTWSTQAYT